MRKLKTKINYPILPNSLSKNKWEEKQRKTEKGFSRRKSWGKNKENARKSPEKLKNRENQIQKKLQKLEKQRTKKTKSKVNSRVERRSLKMNIWVALMCSSLHQLCACAEWVETGLLLVLDALEAKLTRVINFYHHNLPFLPPTSVSRKFPAKIQFFQLRWSLCKFFSSVLILALFKSLLNVRSIHKCCNPVIWNMLKTIVLWHILCIFGTILFSTVCTNNHRVEESNLKVCFLLFSFYVSFDIFLLQKNFLYFQGMCGLWYRTD